MRKRVVVGLLAALAVLVALAEALLPGMAEQRLRDDLARNGEVRHVEVDAFPAVKLLLGRADSIEVRLAESRLDGGRLADLLARTGSAGEVDARADVAHVGPLVVRDARLTKDGDGLRAEAAVTEADLRAALPGSFDLRPLEIGTDGIVLEATALGFSARARVSTRDGALVIAPDGLLSGVAVFTLFRDPRVRVTDVAALSRPDGFTVTAGARLGDA